MKPNPNIQASAAYGPTLSLIRDALEDAELQPGELRVLLQKAAALREFDIPLLSELAGLDEPEPDLVEELRFYVPVEKSGDDSFYIEEYSRQALLEIANREQPELLTEVCRLASSYYENKGKQANEQGNDVQARKYRLQANYYQLFAEPDQGYKSWLRAWEATRGMREGYSRQAELIRITDDAWQSLETVPGAQVRILLLKGWLAYDLSDWRAAKESFYRILNKDPDNEIELNFYLSVRKGRSTVLVDGRRSPVEEAEANVGLGYVHFRGDALRTAARHFEKAIALIGQRFLKYEHAALIRAKALSGLGEVETRIGVPESILLRRFLLPEAERRTTLLEYELAGSQTERLEDLALERLLKKACDHYAEALRIIPDSDSASADRLRIEARQAHLYLELGAFQVAREFFESVRQRELERLGVRSERDIKPDQAHQTADRLIWINIYLGDCYVLSPETPVQEEQELLAWTPTTKAPDLSQVAQDLNKGAYLKGIAAIDSADLVIGRQAGGPQANDFYGAAWSLSKKLNIREGMALSLRRQADMAAMNYKNHQNRDRALHLYTKSLELIEQIGRPDEIARSQERIEILRARVASYTGESEGEDRLSFEKIPRKKRAKRKEKPVNDFLEQVDAYLAFRRRFFRYRVARKLAFRLRRSYRIVTALIALLVGLLGVLLLVNEGTWLIDISGRVTGISWALPALIVAFVTVFAILMADQYVWIRRTVVNRLPIRWFWLSQDQLAVDEVGLHLYDHTGQRKRLIRWPEVWEVRSEYWGERDNLLEEDRLAEGGELEEKLKGESGGLAGETAGKEGVLVQDESEGNGATGKEIVRVKRASGRRQARGSRTAVFGIADPADEKLVTIRFDHQLRGYDRLLESIKAQVESTRWIKPRQRRFVTPSADFLEDSGLLLTLAGILTMAVFLTCPLTLIFALIRPITRFGPAVFAIVAGFVAFMSLLMIVFWYLGRRHMHPRSLGSPPPPMATEKKGYR